MPPAPRWPTISYLPTLRGEPAGRPGTAGSVAAELTLGASRGAELGARVSQRSCESATDDASAPRCKFDMAAPESRPDERIPVPAGSATEPTRQPLPTHRM